MATTLPSVRESMLDALHADSIARTAQQDEPSPAALLSLDQLCGHARGLAARHQLSSRRHPDRLLPQLENNARSLEIAYQQLKQAASQGETISPAAVWLLDNYYLIQEHIRIVRRGLPRKYSVELPQLSGGGEEGLPRVCHVALELIAHADGQIDEDRLQAFTGAYQESDVLRLGELWAIPLMIRLALIENLRSIAVRICRQQHDRQLGEAWANRVLAASRGSFEELLRLTTEMSSQGLKLTPAFVARFMQRMNGQATRHNVAAQWLTQELQKQGQTLDGLVNLDSQIQAGDQVSIGNSISSLRDLRALDWKQFVESQSAVERMLRQDPSGHYEQMDFAGRDHYRHVVERLARRTSLSEVQVARSAIELAEEAADSEECQTPEDAILCHVGFYLVDRGRIRLEKRIGYRPRVREFAARLVGSVRLPAYLGALLAVWLLTVTGASAIAWHFGLASAGLAVALVLLASFAGAASQFSVSIVNWLCTLVMPPREIARLDFSEGIPAEHRAIVVIPTMLTSEKGVRSLIDQLELRYLANQDENLLFALLTDFRDADRQALPGDDHLLKLAKAGIRRLNERYGGGRPGRFFLLHRPRKWNPHEGVWMGEERKRGKLDALNRLLRTGETLPFSAIVGEIGRLEGVKYVITLDTDTGLPHGVARELVGCMAHPMNRPRMDRKTGAIVGGYGILQPRTATSIPDATQSPYSRLLVTDAGIDPYTLQTSDVYQDLFGEGSFIGKGIYDLETFAAATEGRFPDNRVLSHDLIEGCFARSGLASDLELFEGVPTRLLADMSRRHRWIRGDWQIGAWLLPRVPTANGWSANPLSWLSRWKIFDNLRRSLVPAALLIFMVAGWTLVPALAWLWTLLGLAIVFGPSVIGMVPAFVRKPEEKPWRLHFKDQGNNCFKAFVREAIQWSTLPYTVHCHLDAIVRSLFRLTVSHRKLLEWTTASEAERLTDAGWREHYEIMWACTIGSLATAALLAIVAPQALVFAGPGLASWLAGPWIAWRVSRPSPPKSVEMSESDARHMRRWARTTWHFFETHVDDSHHSLPPDNVQERPDWTAAPRTSPTNIGMALAAELVAFDFGYQPASRLLERAARTMRSLGQLERYRGHFFNWYDTRTLQPCEPRYVSTVDSGNLWGSLCVLRVGVEELLDRPLTPPRLVEGLQDTLDAIESLRAANAVMRRADAFDAHLAALHQRCAAASGGGVAATLGFLVEFQAGAERLLRAVPPESADLKRWTEALVEQCAAFREELEAEAFWLGTAEFGTISPATPPILSETRDWLESLDRRGRLCDLLGAPATIERLLAQLPSVKSADVHAAMHDLLNSARHAAEFARRQVELIEEAAALCQQTSAMDFSFLFHPKRKVFAIGFNVSEHRRDDSYYDMLASESRLTSFLAVSHGQVPEEHWFALGRVVTLADGEPALVSWSGSMFEYLMPMLLMPSYPNTILDVSCRAAVRRQIRYGQTRRVPWGISESCYNLIDANLAYRYRAFGVPGLGLQRGLEQDLVIAPYASAMAAMVAPRESCANLRRLEDLGYLSVYGFYDAIDYSSGRRLEGSRPAPCRAVMAHHSGMTLLAMANALLGGPMQRRFLKNPVLSAHDLLLQERVSQAIRPVDPQTLDPGPYPSDAAEEPGSLRIFDTPHTPVPEIHLLSNDRYSVMLTNAGGGYSQCGDRAITRWEDDPTRDHFGSFCYLRDLGTGRFWSNTYQPARVEEAKYLAVFSQGMAEYQVECEDFSVRTRVSVSPEENIEVRQLHITNFSHSPRTIELTSYAEVLLTSRNADRAHRAFSNLFVHTEAIPEAGAILCTRRPRSPDDSAPWMFHLLHIQSPHTMEFSFETSREHFIGRTRDLERPAAMERDTLQGTQGAVLDPVVSARQAVALDGEESAFAYLITGFAESREEALALIEKYRDPRLASRVFELSSAHSRLMLEHLHLKESDAQLYLHLASSLVYPHARYRAEPESIAPHLPRQDVLWSMGIGGDLPIVLVECSDPARLHVVEQLLHAHRYWESKGVASDLVIWAEAEADARRELLDHLRTLVDAGESLPGSLQAGKVYLLDGQQHSAGQLGDLQAVARICFSDEGGSLEEQANRGGIGADGTRPVFAPAARPKRKTARPVKEIARPDLLLFNGIGGFTQDGREYVCVVRPETPTPAPWCNVLANAQFGTVVSESGTGYTWSENAHEFRLTPWSNDPVCDPQGEAIYIRDEQSGQFFSATPLPAPGEQEYLCRHGFGYSIWETTGAGIESRVCTFVAVEQPVKFFLLSLTNRSADRRKISVTGVVQWMLGEHRGRTAPYLVSEIDSQTQALLARNPFNVDFGGRVAVFHSSEPATAFTCDRSEILGHGGSPAAPAALAQPQLSGNAGAALDPAAAIRCEVELEPGEQHEIVFILGAGRDLHQARQLARQCASVEAAKKDLNRVWEQWNDLLGQFRIDTPEPSLNVLANGWLLYQTLACRFWGRSGFYQSGGAFGFRDQLQDSLALLYAAPQLTREHLIRCASRQFVEGDVQHWWHPEAGAGVRTHISDDFLWLPLTASKYVQTTGDWSVLDETAPFLVERPLEPDEETLYTRPAASEETASLYEHCRRAIQHAVRAGPHGLPLMGGGDWNDGMNGVGAAGQGESVWLAFFQIHVLRHFLPIATARGDEGFAQECGQWMETLQRNLERHGWDGRWYRRAYFDNGKPLGSQESEECRIDSLPQSWAVLADAAPEERVRQAMQSVLEHLVRREPGLMCLLAPPFDRSDPWPGYIQGYLPGVRENGGQYTHAAVWATMALALLGDRQEAWDCFQILNPANHTATPDGVARYKVEPYVVAADVYSAPQHEGRGGWTWYTGSAGWMYRLIVETLLGVRLVDGNRLCFDPRVPDAWDRWSMRFRHRQTDYRIEFVRERDIAADAMKLIVDGREQEGAEVHLADDGQAHEITVLLAHPQPQPG